MVEFSSSWVELSLLIVACLAFIIYLEFRVMKSRGDDE